MIRTALVFIYAIGLGVYARRDWFVALCGAVLLMGVVRHPDMPRNIGGIQGLNPWNVLMLCVIVSWVTQRKEHGLVWDMPRGTALLLVLYAGVVVIGFLRMIFDRENLGNMTTSYLISEHLVNCVKWVLPGLILYDTCRTRQQVTLALLVVLGVYLILAIAGHQPYATELCHGRR